MMSDKVRQAIDSAFDRLEKMSDEELLNEIKNAPKTERHDLFKETFGDITMNEFLKNQYPPAGKQEDYMIMRTKGTSVQSVQKKDSYPASSKHQDQIIINTSSYTGSPSWPLAA